MAAQAPNPAAAPSPARTTFQLVAGVPATRTEALWTLPRDSPMVTSMCFIDWDIPVAPARASAPRSLVVGAIIYATRRPTEQELAALRNQPFLTHGTRRAS